jgi:hypothetical protein
MLLYATADVRVSQPPRSVVEITSISSLVRGGSCPLTRLYWGPSWRFCSALLGRGQCFTGIIGHHLPQHPGDPTVRGYCRPGWICGKLIVAPVAFPVIVSTVTEMGLAMFTRFAHCRIS